MCKRVKTLKFYMHVCVRLTWYTGRLISNVIVLGILVGSGFLIYTVADKDILPSTVPESIQELFRKYQVGFSHRLNEK